MNGEIKVSINLMNSILQYLGTKPYAEVFGLIEEIRRQTVTQVSSSNDTAVSDS